MRRSIRDLFRTCAKVLFLRFSKEDLTFGPSHLVFALACAWLAGIGRYWDHPDPEVLQRLGLGSVIYVFILTTLLWILWWPLRLADPQWGAGLRWTHLLTFIALTSPLAFLYAIPVEKFVELETAQRLNVWFLAIVALWRVAIYFRFLRVCLDLPPAVRLVAGLLPLCGIVAALAVLNLEKAVFQLMAGLGEPPPGTPADAAYRVVFGISLWAMLAAPVLALGYLLVLVNRRRSRAKARNATGAGP